MQSYIHEIFSAIQGEGPLVGIRQIFIRFCECNLSCRYCDTQASRGQSKTCRVEKNPGERKFKDVANPLRSLQLLEATQNLNLFPHHSIAITGGEPLLQAEFLAEALPILSTRLPIYLETNGTLPEALFAVISNIDYLSMDIKIPSATREKELLSIHKNFLQIAVNNQKEFGNPREIFVKMIVTQDTVEEELIHAFHLVAELDPNTDTILQPVSEVGDGKIKQPASRQMLQWQELGLRHLKRVRVIPQMHKLMGQM